MSTTSGRSALALGHRVAATGGLAHHLQPFLALHQETEGNPFFVQETLKHLIEDAVGPEW